MAAAATLRARGIDRAPTAASAAVLPAPASRAAGKRQRRGLPRALPLALLPARQREAAAAKRKRATVIAEAAGEVTRTRATEGRQRRRRPRRRQRRRWEPGGEASSPGPHGNVNGTHRRRRQDSPDLGRGRVPRSVGLMMSGKGAKMAERGRRQATAVPTWSRFMFAMRVAA